MTINRAVKIGVKQKIVHPVGIALDACEEQKLKDYPKKRTLLKPAFCHGI